MNLLTALVIPFPRAHRVAADYSPDALYRKVRMSALAAGCNRVQALLAEAHAQGLLEQGIAPSRILPAADEFARQMVEGVS